jgi:hypothetical protein
MKIGENGIILFTVAGLDITTVDKVIFTIKGNGTVTKEYPSDYVSFDNGIFFVGLAQEDTLIISGGKQIRAQAEAQINFKTSQVAKSSTITFMLNSTLSTEIVPGNTPADKVAALNLEYVNNGILVDGVGRDGKDGKDGAKGDNGESAYEVAVSEGFEGTKEEWLASLKGATGDDGKSAYQIAVETGYTGTKAQWVASLKGTDGESAYQSATEGGFDGTKAEFDAALSDINMTKAEMLNILEGGEQ